MPKQRRATHEEMTFWVKLKAREIVGQKDALKARWKAGLISQEQYMLEVSKLTGKLAGMRNLLSYALWGELEEVSDEL